MTIEEKAQRYDEAIKRAKSLLSDNQLGNAWIYKLLPELKESEDVDEKVRKALIKLVTNHASMDLFIEYDIHLDEALSWLEKQGEQKPIGKVEQSEEDEKMLDIILNDINYAQKNFSDSKLTPYDRKVDWLKSLKDRVQPKQEWSEEDELNLSEALHHIRMYNLANKADKLDKWLKSLKTRVQPQQQKWSEEDKIIRNALIKLVEGVYDSSIYKYDRDRLLDWLKSQN